MDITQHNGSRQWPRSCFLSALAGYPDAPDWDDYFEANLAPYVMGYAYAVARNGQTIITGGGPGPRRQ